MATLIEILRAKYPSLEFEHDPATGAILLIHEDTAIYDPFRSECGRFQFLQPSYGLSMESAIMLRDHNLPLIEE